MSDLTDEKLTALLSAPDGAGIADTHRMVVEISRHRATQAASADRVLVVVREACQRFGYTLRAPDIDAIVARVAAQLPALATPV